MIQDYYSFNLEASDDLMEAYLSVSPINESAPSLTEEDIKDYLKKFHITQGLDEKNIAEIVSKGRCYRVPVANGEPSKDGDDAFFESLINIPLYETTIDPKLLETFDIKNTDNIVPTVPAGTPLMRKIPATEGKSGKDVFGRPLPPGKPGKDKPLYKGKNTDFDPNDPNILISTIEGYPIVGQCYVNIEPIKYFRNGLKIEIRERDEKVEFDGIIVVFGTVGDGITIRSSADVIIIGAAGAVLIEAQRNVIISGGVTGKQMSVVKTRGSVISRFLEMCTIESGRDVIADDITQSFVISCGKVVCKRIVGGEITATYLVEADSIGLEKGDTGITVGVNPYIEDYFLKRVREDMDKKIIEKQEIMKEIKRLVFSKEPEEKERLQELRNSLPKIEQEIYMLKDIESGLLELEKMSDKAQIISHEEILAGVMIVMRVQDQEFDYFVEEDMGGMIFKAGKYGIIREEIGSEEENISEEEVN